MTVVVSELSDYPPGDMCSRAAMSQLKSVSYASILVFHQTLVECRFGHGSGRHTCFGYFRSPFSFRVSVFSTWGILGLSTKKSSPPIDMLII